MRMILIDYGLWKCAIGQDQDVDRDSRALAKICLVVKPICVSHIRGAMTARQAWESLEKAFQNSGLSRSLTLKRKLYRTRYEDYSSMGEYVSAVLSLVHQLADIKKVIPDDEVGELLLSGLPDSFESLISRFAATHTEVKSEEVQKLLLEEECRRELKRTDAALLLKGKHSSFPSRN